MKTLTKVFEFDAAHRVMNERVKCFNLHGHRWSVELTLGYERSEQLGYAIDFKEVKRVFGGWIDRFLDHACIVNPLDEVLVNVCKEENWKLYKMGMGDFADINPSAENMASELFAVAAHLLCTDNIKVVKLRLAETPSCWVETNELPMITEEFADLLQQFRKEMGVVEYDSRRCQGK